MVINKGVQRENNEWSMLLWWWCWKNGLFNDAFHLNRSFHKWRVEATIDDNDDEANGDDCEDEDIIYPIIRWLILI